LRHTETLATGDGCPVGPKQKKKKFHQYQVNFAPRWEMPPTPWPHTKCKPIRWIGKRRALRVRPEMDIHSKTVLKSQKTRRKRGEIQKEKPTGQRPNAQRRAGIWSSNVVKVEDPFRFEEERVLEWVPWLGGSSSWGTVVPTGSPKKRRRESGKTELTGVFDGVKSAMVKTDKKSTRGNPKKGGICGKGRPWPLRSKQTEEKREGENTRSHEKK